MPAVVARTTPQPADRSALVVATFQERSEVMTWLAAAHKGAEAFAEEAGRGPLFGELAGQWWHGVESGTIGKRKGRGGSG